MASKHCAQMPSIYVNLICQPTLNERQQKQTNFIIFSGISQLICWPVIIVVAACVAAAVIAFIVDVGVVIIGVWKFNHYAAVAASATRLQFVFSFAV